MTPLSEMVARALQGLAALLEPPRVYHGATGPYLSRWTLLDGGHRWRLYLHFFHRSDEDRDLHTHPWWWAIALQLAGGYREERLVGGQIVTRVHAPGSVVVLRSETAHRVDLLDARGSWSVILVGPRIASWGFVDRDTGAFTAWREALRRKGIEPAEAS
jgi:hypothetical protein